MVTVLSACLLAFALSGMTMLTSYADTPNDTIQDLLDAGEYEEGVVIVGIDKSEARKDAVLTSLLEEKMLFEDESEGLFITTIRLDDRTTEELLSLLTGFDSVLFAEPNYIVSGESEDETPAEEITEQENDTASSARDMTALQWSSSEEATFRAAGAQGNVSINVPGWPDGSNMEHEIIVAVIDQAIDFSNPDLADRAYTFSPELQEKLGCDVHGFNATWESEDGKLEYFEGADHGTHVAGIIGASWDGSGINGVGSNVRLVSVQNSNDDGKTSLVNILRAMNFIKEAKQNGVDIRICNNSWQLLQNSKALDAAVTELGEMGIVTFFAAGNDAQNLNEIQHIQSTLAVNPYVIIVASADVTGNLAASSCYGNGVVTLAAPGVDILSTIIDDQYIPMMAEQNTFYEDFENGTAALKIYQIDPETGKKVEGTDGIIVNSDEAMGFEGEKVLKVPVNHDYTSESWAGDLCSFQVDFSCIEGLELDPGDSFGFAYAGFNEVGIYSVSGYGSDVWFFGKWSHKGSWDICDIPLDDEAIEIGPGPSLIITMDASLVDELYFDTIGLGSEKYPYGFKSGTSMACPAAAGAAAVLASRHYDELTAGDADYAKKLAGYVRSSVRPMPGLDGKVSTGGIIDLAVDASASDPADQPAPDITDVAVSGTEVTLTGTGFGKTGGTVEIRKYIFGTESTPIGSEISEWKDTSVTLSLSEDFEGIIEAELTAANGKQDVFVKFISKSSNLFETDLNIDSDTGEAFLFDPPDGADPDTVQMGDAESSGMMMVLDGKIYYMPVIAKVEKEPVYRSLYCYDPEADSWSACTAFPEWITIASGTAYDGKLYVKGNMTKVDESGKVPYYDEYDDDFAENICVYSYTPGDDSWQRCSVENVRRGQTLFSTEDGLMLAGEFVVPGDPDDEDDWGYVLYPIMIYDPANGGGEIVGAVPQWTTNPIMVNAFGHICIIDEYGTELYVLSEDLSEEGIIEIDTPLVDPTLDRWALPETNTTQFSLTGDENMLVLVFSDYINGSTADIFIMKNGDSSFIPYEKRVSDAALFGPAATIIDGRLYVLSSSIFEPDKRLFRSTVLTEYFDITYDPCGGNFDGSTSVITEKHAKGSVISIHEAPVREGYTFLYWQGSEHYPGDEYTVAEDHTFVAVWEKENVPETGDHNRMGLWIVLMMAALAVGISILILARRKQKNR